MKKLSRGKKVSGHLIGFESLFSPESQLFEYKEALREAIRALRLPDPSFDVLPPEFKELPPRIKRLCREEGIPEEIVAKLLNPLRVLIFKNAIQPVFSRRGAYFKYPQDRELRVYYAKGVGVRPRGKDHLIMYDEQCRIFGGMRNSEAEWEAICALLGRRLKKAETPLPLDVIRLIEFSGKTPPPKAATLLMALPMKEMLDRPAASVNMPASWVSRRQLLQALKAAEEYWFRTRGLFPLGAHLPRNIFLISEKYYRPFFGERKEAVENTYVLLMDFEDTRRLSVRQLLRIMNIEQERIERWAAEEKIRK